MYRHVHVRERLAEVLLLLERLIHQNFAANERGLGAALNSADGEAASLAGAASQVQGDISNEENFLDARALGIEENAFNQIKALDVHGIEKEDAYRILSLEKKVEAMRT